MLITSANTNIALRLSDSPIIKSELEQSLEYGGIIYIDTNASTSGDTYPYGTPAAPVNNALDAQAIGALYGISSFFLTGTLLLGGPGIFNNFEIRGGANAQMYSTGEPILSNGIVTNCVVSGDLGAGSSNMEFRSCHIEDGALNLSGNWFNSGFKGTFTVAENKDTLMIDCFSEIGGSSSPTLVMPTNPTSENNLSIRGYKGGLLVQGFKDNMVATIALASGKVTLDNSNIGGSISVRGFPYSAFTDNSVGTVVDTNSLLTSQTTLEELQVDLTIALQTIEFDNRIHIDIINGISGILYPAGTRSFPSNNLVDAIVIAENRGLRDFTISSDLTIDEDLSNGGYVIEGHTGGEILTFTGTDTTNISLENIFITGDMAGYRSRMQNCRLYNLVGYSGVMYNTAILGNLTIAEGILDAALLVNSHTSVGLEGVPGYNVPVGGITITLGTVGGAEKLNLDMRGFSGTVIFENIDHADKIVSAHFTSGYVHIKPSCSAGTLYLQGIVPGAIFDESTGTFINYEELKVVLMEENKQLIRDAMALGTAETPALDSVDHKVDRIDDNTQE